MRGEKTAIKMTLRRVRMGLENEKNYKFQRAGVELLIGIKFLLIGCVDFQYFSFSVH